MSTGRFLKPTHSQRQCVGSQPLSLIARRPAGKILPRQRLDKESGISQPVPRYPTSRERFSRVYSPGWRPGSRHPLPVRMDHIDLADEQRKLEVRYAETSDELTWSAMLFDMWWNNARVYPNYLDFIDR